MERPPLGAIARLVGFGRTPTSRPSISTFAVATSVGDPMGRTQTKTLGASAVESPLREAGAETATPIRLAEGETPLLSCLTRIRSA